MSSSINCTVAFLIIPKISSSSRCSKSFSERFPIHCIHPCILLARVEQRDRYHTRCLTCPSDLGQISVSLYYGLLQPTTLVHPTIPFFVSHSHFSSRDPSQPGLRTPRTDLQLIALRIPSRVNINVW